MWLGPCLLYRLNRKFSYRLLDTFSNTQVLVTAFLVLGLENPKFDGFNSGYSR